MATPHCIEDQTAGTLRVLDTRIAERLGFAAPRQIRELIERNRTELGRVLINPVPVAADWRDMPEPCSLFS
jgi:hypothetical protein